MELPFGLQLPASSHISLQPFTQQWGLLLGLGLCGSSGQTTGTCFNIHCQQVFCNDMWVGTPFSTLFSANEI